ncbi:hypothetical protein F0562_026698 [Nyssa sinensis]|uniref:Plastid division protein PDV1 n=1 Tax=Nyssa sinensis TaxID=561372 RepID=A0A5J5BC21_9ASTE|nr:hypothetical protein F0562_026698 [Nyssa sinensis]
MGMELEEMEAVLEKFWDLHDKLSDAIHLVSRTHYLNSIKSIRKSDDVFIHRSFKKKQSFNDSEDNHQTGNVFVKYFRVDEDDSAIQEAKSLNAIRSALENLEDQLEFFHTVQTQQQAERDAAFAHLEQSWIVLSMRLSEHQGRKFKVIEEALDFVGGAGWFVSPENLYGSRACPSAENFVSHGGKRSNILIKVLVSSLTFGKKSLKLNHLVGILGNAALVAVSMFPLLHLRQVACKDRYILNLPQKQADVIFNRNVTIVSQPEDSSSNGGMTHLDVVLARG